MPKSDPDPDDPLQLEAACIPDPEGTATESMAECFAEEFLRLGHPPEQVLAMFRSAEYSLPHHAWKQLGDERIRVIVHEQSELWWILTGRRFRC